MVHLISCVCSLMREEATVVVLCYSEFTLQGLILFLLDANESNKNKQEDRRGYYNSSEPSWDNLAGSSIWMLTSAKTSSTSGIQAFSSGVALNTNAFIIFGRYMRCACAV